MKRALFRRSKTSHVLEGGAEVSTRQVAAFLTALALILVLSPIGAQAATFFSVFITDPSNHSLQASVDSSGSLKVGDGSGPLTVDGGVMAAPALAANSLLDTVSLDSFHPGGSPAAEIFGREFSPGDKVAITSLTITNEIETNSFVSSIDVEFEQPISGSPCGVGGTVFDVAPAITMSVGPQATQHLDFPYPVVVPTGTPSDDWCVRGFVFGSDRQVSLTVVGYLVPAA
jgi:hypothetical protein